MPARYAFYLYVKDLPELLVAINRQEVLFRDGGHPDLADRLLKAYGELRADLEYLSASIAGAGTVALKDHEHNSRVRPDTLGGGGPRLEDFLECDPLPEIPGSVGVANEEVLDANVPWWPTNEEGSDARVGGHIFGTFFNSSFSNERDPNSEEFRVHPLFEANIEGGPGVIHKPIPARRFIKDAIPSIELRWKSQFARYKAKFNDTLTELYAIRDARDKKSPRLKEKP